MTARALLVMHAVLGFTTVFATTLHAAYALLSAAGRFNARALRRFGWIAPAAVVAEFALGLALYPAYRLHVRADFDRNAPLFSQLFDFKEHLAALSLPLLVVASLGGRLEDGRSPEARWSIAALSSTGALFVWAVAVLGLCVTAKHAV